MKYRNVCEGRFVERPNRFIAYVEAEGGLQKVHVKNTGRCKEILLPGTTVFLEKSDNPTRSTAYDLIAAKKGNRVINIDSQAPNKAVEEWLKSGGLFSNLRLVRPETVFGNSRFDFYAETDKEKIFIEVKGVTQEQDNVVMFPDAPSERAVKHVDELIEAKGKGYRVFVLFVVQMTDVKYMTPNKQIHPQFAQALTRAAEAGVEILAVDCEITPDEMRIKSRIPVVLCEESMQTAEDIYKLGNIGLIAEPLLKWYDKNRRILPWRENPTPYHVWVSEIMLQQTRVEAVKPYYARFMNALPDCAALAAAPEEELLKLWEGLGYYNRVRNLQKAAIQIMENYGGKMPDKYEEILKLTGIGSYTAGAISSIAFGIKRPAVDGNVLRVLSRIRMDERLISDAKVKEAVEEELLPAMPANRPGDFNQAMMEIGACVCIGNGMPLCDACPLAGICKAHAAGVETAYPKKMSKKPRSVEEKTILVVQDDTKVAIRKRADKGLLAGMYEFPSLQGHKTAEEVVDFLKNNGIKTLRILPMEDVKHIFTHREWHMTGFHVKVDELEQKQPGEPIADWIYIEPGETKTGYPIPSAFQAYAEHMSIKQGKRRHESEE